MIGFTFQYAPFVIERGKIREFAKVLGLKNKMYYDINFARKHGYRDIPIPPTFPTVFDYWNEKDLYMLFKELNINITKVLHGEQAYEYVEQMYANDRIQGLLTIENMKSKNNKVFYYTKTVYKNQDNQIVLISKATYIQLKDDK
jgi:hypothetical protein